MPTPSAKSLVSVLCACGLALIGALSAFAQVAGDPYKKADPADEDRQFVASHVGQPKADETLDQLKKLYAEAARYYVTNSKGRILLRADTVGAAEPLSWEAFGVGLKAGQSVIVRLTETPDPTLDVPNPKSEVIEYTVRWLPADAKPAPAPAPVTGNARAASPPDPQIVVKVAAAASAYIQTILVKDSSFIGKHAAYKSGLDALAAAAQAVTTQDGGPTSDQIASFVSCLNTCAHNAESWAGPSGKSITSAHAAQWRALLSQITVPPATADNSAPSPSTPLKKAAADLLAYITTLRTEQASFLRYHSGFTPKLLPIDALAQVLLTEEGDPSPAQVQTLTKNLDSAIAFLTMISKRPIKGTPEAVGVKQTETEDYIATATQMIDQFTSLNMAISDAAPPAVTSTPPAAAPDGP